MLAGTIGALLAQGLAPYDAARLGVYLHGAAGDVLRDRLGDAGMLAGDLPIEITIARRRLATMAQRLAAPRRLGFGAGGRAIDRRGSVTRAVARSPIERRLADAGLPPLPRAAWLEIDLDLLRGNLAALRAALPAGVRLEHVLKADGYGHGAVPVGRALEAAGADGFSVAAFDEAVELRAGGIRGPILCLYAVPPELIPEAMRLAGRRGGLGRASAGQDARRGDGGLDRVDRPAAAGGAAGPSRRRDGPGPGRSRPDPGRGRSGARGRDAGRPPGRDLVASPAGRRPAPDRGPGRAVQGGPRRAGRRRRPAA